MGNEVKGGEDGGGEGKAGTTLRIAFMVSWCAVVRVTTAFNLPGLPIK